MAGRLKSIQGKLLVLVGAIVLLATMTVAFMSVNQLSQYGETSIENLRDQLEEEHRRRLTDLTNTAYSLLEEYHALAQSEMLSTEEAQEQALERIRDMRYENGAGYFWVHDAQIRERPVMIMHPIQPELNDQDLSNINDFDTFEKVFYQGETYSKNNEVIQNNISPTDLFIKMNEVALDQGEGFVHYYWTKAEGEKAVGYPKLSNVKLFAPWGWVIGTGVYIDSIDAEVAEAGALMNSNIIGARTKVIGGTVISLLTGLILCVWLSSRISRPIKNIAAAVEKAAEGDITQHIEVKSSDESGTLAKAFNAMLKEWRQIISSIRDTSQTLSSHSQELASSSQEVSATVQEVASTTNEVAAIASQGAENAREAAQDSEQVQQVAEEGNKAVKETVEKMHSISSASQDIALAVKNLGDQSNQIGEIIETITNIADQTNLLALNAAIEAARAGEHGKGFAVVAEEVRKLAEQSAQAASEITGLIEKIQVGVNEAVSAIDHGVSEVESGVEVANNAGTALNEIIAAIQKNTTAIKDLAQGIEQSNEGMQQLSASSEQITSAVQQVSSAAQELANVAGDLQNTIDKFSVDN